MYVRVILERFGQRENIGTIVMNNAIYRQRRGKMKKAKAFTSRGHSQKIYSISRDGLLSVFGTGLALVLSLACIKEAQAFALKDKDGRSIHGSITREALGNKFSSKNLAVLIESGDQTLPSTGQFFFSKGKLKSSLSFLDREQKKIINYCHDADSNPKDRYRALKHLGALLRASQDFYSHSKYLELESERLKNRKDKTFDPYQIDLVDWSKVTDPDYKALNGSTIDDGGRPMETEEEGAEKLGGTTYFRAARELAVRETARQWDMLSTLIKRKYKDKSLTILTALREASAPSVDDDDVN